MTLLCAVLCTLAALLSIGGLCTTTSAGARACLLGVLWAASTGALLVIARELLHRQERRHERRLRAMLDAVNASSAKTSRRDWHLGQRLDRLERVAASAQTSAEIASSPVVRGPQAAHPVPQVLFVTSNGGGIGHISRCAAVLRAGAEHLGGAILTLSPAATLFAGAGVDVSYFPSQSTLAWDLDRWGRAFARRVIQEIDFVRPDVLVFDGTWVYAPVIALAKSYGIPLVWLRRGLWRAGVDLEQVRDSRRLVSRVIVPGDIGGVGAEGAATEPDAIEVGPITNALVDPPYPRNEAAARLGLRADRQYALVQLSGGNQQSAHLEDHAVTQIRAHCRDVVPVVVRSPLREVSPVPDGAVAIDAVFPLSNFSRLWELSVSRAGYNSVHENIEHAVPGIYLPSARTLTDDQERRAEAVAGRGLGLCATESSVAEAVRRLARSANRDAVREELARHVADDGPQAAAQAIAGTTRIAPEVWR